MFFPDCGFSILAHNLEKRADNQPQSMTIENRQPSKDVPDFAAINALTEATIEKKLDTLHNLLADQIKKNEDDKQRL